MKVLFFDTETTGLIPRDVAISDTMRMPYIVQFSYMIYDFEADKIDVISDDIIRVPCVIPEESIKFHGITDAISREMGKDMNEVLDVFVTHVNQVDRVVSHNMEFDLKIVLVELMRFVDKSELLSKEKYSEAFNQLNTTHVHKYYCTVKESVNVCKIKAMSRLGKEYNKFPTLSELHKHYFGFVPIGLHNSMNDVVVGMRCFGKLYFEKACGVIESIDICEKNEQMREMMEHLTPPEFKMAKVSKVKGKRKPRKRNSKKRNKSN